MARREDENPDSSSAQAAALPAFVRVGEGAFHEVLRRTPGVAVVLFSAPHCGACRAWKRLLPQALAGLADALLEIDVSEATGVARAYDIFHLPTIHLYRDGAFHAELQCALRAETIAATARTLLSAPAQEEP
jgi:thioredoxin-like negative regulator of GroEL